ncbi:GreA/GreB family elongation factor [Saccharothrix obliqua]|uniref:GreA/GreB family elongation factor n=1 Tax=Saccharothrix obliqua TaxID=2861747 RepID=UPI001C5E8AC9|nr:GreA/GreB family elongation factor [Saccharothrix obliqua]MBW4716792.1 GreA/GreB family elongation factor [Saccharothrix obliqua]
MTKHIWLTPQAHDRLQAELAELLALPAPREDEAEPAVLTRRQRDLRIREVRELLAKAIVGEDPPDDGVAEPGMVLTVRFDDTDETETFLLGVRDVEHGDLEVYSPGSPLGTALSGARPGDQRSYPLPNGNTMRVTLLKAVPYGHHSKAS